MIFVTVGSTLAFDDLIEAMDRFVERTLVSESVVCQIGGGTYIPRHCDYFRFAPSIEELVDNATVVVGHGGTGTVSSLFASRKPFVAVANPAAADNHQAQFLARLSQDVSILWTKDLEELPALIQKARTFTIRSLRAEPLAADLKAFLRES